jgi:3-phenylpropionate/cinnamic acid dioxygenase small subunit
MPDAESRVGQLLGRYANALDEDRLEDWPNFFTESGVYRITTAENEARGLPLPVLYCDSRAMMRDRVASLRNANIYEPQRYRHLVSSTLIERMSATEVKAVSNFLVIRTMQDGETALFASGRYRDRILLTGDSGLAQFEERIVVCDSRKFDTLLAIPL